MKKLMVLLPVLAAFLLGAYFSHFERRLQKWKTECLTTLQSSEIQALRFNGERHSEHLPVAQNSPGISWSASLQDSLQEARKSHHFLLLDFYTDWCVYCKIMDKKVYPNPEVVQLSRQFVCTKINIDQAPKLARQFRIIGLPTLVFLKPSGEEIKRWTGLISSDELARLMRSISASQTS